MHLSPQLAYPLPTTDQEVHQIRKLVCEILAAAAEDSKLLLRTARPTTGHASAPRRADTYIDTTHPTAQSPPMPLPSPCSPGDPHTPATHPSAGHPSHPPHSTTRTQPPRGAPRPAARPPHPVARQRPPHTPQKTQPPPPSLSRDLRSGYHRQLGRRRSYDSPEHTTYHRQPYATYRDRTYRSPPSRERSPRGGFPPPPPGPPPAGRRQHRDGTPPLTTAAISPGSRGRKASRSGQSVRSRRETAAPGPRRESSGQAWGAGPDKATARAVRVESVPGKKGKSL